MSTSKTCRFLLLCLLSALPVPRAHALLLQDQAPEVKKEAEASPAQEFQALLDRVKKSDASVDFGRMRQLQTRLDDYEPYRSNLEDHPFKALDRGKVEQAQAIAEHNLAANYLDLEAHFALAVIADKKGDTAAAAHHWYVVQGVVDSILRSGDGKTPETAYGVVAISEEYATMQQLGLGVTGQALVNANGHSYDVLTGEDRKSHAKREVYFNIDPILGSLAKDLGQ